jgi:hypothetical protein
MGMDQWIMAKTTKREAKPATGVCSGIFGIVPSAVAEDIELGYIRKGYDQNQLIWETARGKRDEDTGNLYLSAEDIADILEEAARILAEHKFSEDDEYDETDDDPKFRSWEGTWLSKRKWGELIKSLKEAQAILAEDPDAVIYYHMWN